MPQRVKSRVLEFHFFGLHKLAALMGEFSLGLILSLSVVIAVEDLSASRLTLHEISLEVRSQNTEMQLTRELILFLFGS